MSMGNIELLVKLAESEIRRLFGQGDISGQSRHLAVVRLNWAVIVLDG